MPLFADLKFTSHNLPYVAKAFFSHPFILRRGGLKINLERDFSFFAHPHGTHISHCMFHAYMFIQAIEKASLLLPSPVQDTWRPPHFSFITRL